MTRKIIFVFFFASATAVVNAQTKGLNTLSAGVSTLSNETTFGGTSQKQTGGSATLGYGHFINDRSKIGFSVAYGSSTIKTNGITQSTAELWGGGLSYQHYYPLLKKFYAYAGARTGFSTTTSGGGTGANNLKANSYTAGGFGGLTYFVSKHFAFETTLLSADASYSRQKGTSGTPSTVSAKNSSFNLETAGTLSNLNFSIQFLF